MMRLRGDPSLSSLIGICGLLCSERSSLGADARAIRSGKVSISVAMGNALADKAAGMADQATDSEHRTGLLSYSAQKQQTYISLIAAISRRIIRVTTHTRTCRQAAEEEHAKTDAGRFVLTPAVPKFACIADSVTLRLVDPPPLC